MNKKNIFFVLIAGLAVTLSFILSSMSLPKNTAKIKKPSRIICMAPNIAEIVFALGAAKQVVGVSDFCNFPPEVMKKPRVGGFSNPNFEKIVVLAPDLMILSGEHERVARFCQRKGISRTHIHMSNILSIYQNIEKLSSILKREQQAKQLIASIKTELAQATPTNSKSVSVFLCLSSKLSGNIFTCGRGTFINEVLELVGAKNIFSDIKKTYFEISKESLLKRAPQRIIQISGRKLTKKERQHLKKQWQKLSLLPAVKNGHIYILDEDYLLIPGPRVGSIAKKFAKCVK